MEPSACHIDKRWEDDLNEFVKDEETEAAQSKGNNDTWLVASKSVYEWEKKQRQHAKHHEMIKTKPVQD